MMKKILDSINKIELDNKKIILILIAALFIFYLDYFFIMARQVRGIKSLKPKIVSLKKDIRDFKKDSKNINNLKTGKTQGADARQIISEEGLPLLFEEISNLSNKHNASIVQILPVKQEKPADIEAAAHPANFSPVYIILDLSAGYHNIGSFINGLENLEEFIIVQDIKMRRKEEDYLTERAELLLKVYVKK